MEWVVDAVNSLEIVVDFSGWMWYSGTMAQSGRLVMRRKARPMHHLVVEGLSTGMPSEPAIERDDWTGEVIAVQAQPVLHQPRIIKNWRKHQRDEKIRYKQTMLQEYLAQRSKAHELILNGGILPLPELKPAVNQIHTQSNLVITVGKSPPWRRL